LTVAPPNGDAERPATPRRNAGELALRIVSALILAPLAAGVAYLGDWPFAIMWILAGAGTFWEWSTLSLRSSRAGAVAVGFTTLEATGILLGCGYPGTGLGLLVAGALAAALVCRTVAPGWAFAGLLYAGTIVAAPIMLRGDDTLGLTSVVLLFAVVWATDIAAYFTGRAIGGPKLWPAVSPKKTWSGAIGGTVAAVVCAMAVAHVAGLPSLGAIGALAVALSVASQGGDFLESAIKRRFGAKDSGALIPGHGGLMDRLDGFVTAALLAALIGIVRAGLEAPSRGLLIW
jgi:phosphatidate cytidylyltransferase